MTRRGFGSALMMAVLALSLPLGAVAAHDSKGNDQGHDGDHRDHHGKILVCHRPQSAHPVTIMISKAAWKTHKAHGDTQGQCPKPPKPAQGTCTFDAATSVYNNGPLATDPLYATGPIRFSWTVATGVVTAPGGYWNQMWPPPPATVLTTRFDVTAGTVSSANAVTLSLVASGNSPQAFSGTLTGSTLTGLMSGFYFSATGTVACTLPKPPEPPKPAQGTCTFDAPTSVYNSGPSSTSPLYATGPIRFSWTVATGLVTVPGGYWNELYPPTPPSTTYPYAITAGTVASTNAVNLSLVWPAGSTPMSFNGQLTGSTLTGIMTGNFYFSATGTVSCTGTGHEHHDD